MTARSPELDSSIRELDRAFSDEELVDLLLALARRPDRDARNMLAHLAAGWPAEGSELLDAAATVASRHDDWAGDDIRLRRWLTVLSHSREFAAQLGGDPQHVLDGLERSALDQARLQGEAIESIWREAMLKPGDAALALGARATNREKVRRLRERSVSARTALRQRIPLSGVSVRYRSTPALPRGRLRSTSKSTQREIRGASHPGGWLRTRAWPRVQWTAWEPSALRIWLRPPERWSNRSGSPHCRRASRLRRNIDGAPASFLLAAGTRLTRIHSAQFAVTDFNPTVAQSPAPWRPLRRDAR